MPQIKLCKFSELVEIESRGFVISDVTPERNIFIVRRGDEVYGYENSCPHNFMPMDWSPDVFLSHDSEYIQCANHGALFEIGNGICIYGPCMGQSLQPVQIEVHENIVFAVF